MAAGPKETMLSFPGQKVNGTKAVAAACGCGFSENGNFQGSLIVRKQWIDLFK